MWFELKHWRHQSSRDLGKETPEIELYPKLSAGSLCITLIRALSYDGQNSFASRGLTSDDR